VFCVDLTHKGGSHAGTPHCVKLTQQFFTVYGKTRCPVLSFMLACFWYKSALFLHIIKLEDREELGTT